MRSSDRPVLAAGSTDRSDFAREARLRRHDAQLDGPWDVSGLCRSTSDLLAPAPGGTKARARTRSANDSSEGASQVKESTYGLPRRHRVDVSPYAQFGHRLRTPRVRNAL